MQPYFFPYIGYFQLMRAVERFVFYDDVQYLKGGRVNRNTIALDGQPKWLTLPIARDHLTLDIRERHYLFEDAALESIRRKIIAAYRRAPAFAEAFPLIDSALGCARSGVADFNIHLLKTIAHGLGLHCAFTRSSELGKDPDSGGETRVLDICSRLDAHRYINAIGGRELYTSTPFSARGIELVFLRTLTKPFVLGQQVQHLSIIHHLMMFGIRGTAAQLDDFELVAPLE